MAASRLILSALVSDDTNDLGNAAPTRSLERSAADIARLLTQDWSQADRERLSRILFEARGLVRAAKTYGDRLDSQPQIVLHGSGNRFNTQVTKNPAEWQTWDSAVQMVLAMEAHRNGPARLGVWRYPGNGHLVSDLPTALDDLRTSLRFPPPF